MTNSFEVKLGEGGYGTVFKGSALDSCPVAVKVLNASKGNGEEFINEVVSISRTSHVNIVTLLGFCVEGSKKALVYELMPNGSLEKFICKRDLAPNDPPLSWEKLLQIAEGIAKGLEYLHRGCSTRILHFDIKPNNILLDKNLCPKISDFGLAKLCSKTRSIVSMLDARGTVGYIAPEVWNRNFGGVSHKSDVYSYGMLILEMVGGRQNINRDMNDSSDIYFPHLLYNQIEIDKNVTEHDGMTREESEIAKKMIMVGLWCVQTMPSDRPPMNRVIEMLEGSLDQLPVPPKPFMFPSIIPTTSREESGATNGVLSFSNTIREERMQGIFQLAIGHSDGNWDAAVTSGEPSEKASILLRFLKVNFCFRPYFCFHMNTLPSSKWLPFCLPHFLPFKLSNSAYSSSPLVSSPRFAPMDNHPIPLLTSILTVSFFFSIALPQSYSQQNETYPVCSQPYSCGSLTNISYPFWGQNRPSFCGRNGFRLVCPNDLNTTIQAGSQTFHVLKINQSGFTMRLVPPESAYNLCPPNISNISLSSSPFSFLSTVQNITVLYDCPSQISGANNLTCQNNPGKQAFYVNETQLQRLSGFDRCGYRIQVPVSVDIPLGSLKNAPDEGFDVKYDASECEACKTSGGTCGANQSNSSMFSCYCRDGTAHNTACSTSSSKRNKVLKLVLGFVATGVGLPLIAVTICKNKAKIWRFITSRVGNKKKDREIEAFLRSQGPLALERYSFSALKKMTDSFKVKLGEGGYGAVYKGKLLDGCAVAVKLLHEASQDSEDFINEVSSIGKTSHVNVVTLLGFCLEGRRRALIYEFMSNGSLEKFISKKKPDDQTVPSLSWETLNEIAKGIARGLDYLHKGCNTRILHFDIKPHNILLDEKYHPKISDFGLAKLNTKEESIISISNARGTIGYVAPEVWNKSIGGVSHKSDVYSYGMMLLEMVGGRKNTNVVESEGSSGSGSELYFPPLTMYKKLEAGSDVGGVKGMTSDEENEIAKKMTMVGLWCIQTIPAQRPTMSRVIEMLEASTESLEMPPKPFMSSPSTSTSECSFTLASLQSA
ncbi:LEAF RUST 10 DISEASE-RESISTANCE LOCUS RECEPTOR-LIKE PROTEIN KINASE-like 2.1 [Neltuma alba]|uniref:LEAF RUST 10 DISEASE-RESISTANCE LOCUS RECEPTOR-LIKE PROTEIN KINASE-like 2.1 n=1 Tax=Neltuma alba TaxID=207710 RepID=UPI0010A3A31B|nr:LEAF RUST 10 DISEASE-RESISTANCE LOCUS RECEPTOR-LIKE PROTEIN KINASE-like 2.1 [Prosopis alba]